MEDYTFEDFKNDFLDLDNFYVYGDLIQPATKSSFGAIKVGNRLSVAGGVVVADIQNETMSNTEIESLLI